MSSATAETTSLPTEIPGGGRINFMGSEAVEGSPNNLNAFERAFFARQMEALAPDGQLMAASQSFSLAGMVTGLQSTEVDLNNMQGTAQTGPQENKGVGIT